MHREGEIRVHPLRGFGLVRVGAASQSLDGVVFVGLAQAVPQPLFNDRAQQPTGVVLGDAEGVRDRRKEINAIRLGIFEMAELDGLLPECFTAGIMLEVIELNMGPDGLMEMIWLKSTSFGLLGGECLVIQDLFVRRERGVKKRLHFGVVRGCLGLHFGRIRGGVFHSLRGWLQTG